MYNKIIILLALLFITTLVYADPQRDTDHFYTRGEINYTIADKVNIRIKPYTKAQVVAQLAIGSEVQVQSKESKNFTVKNYTAPWLKVMFKHKGKALTGYVWAGLITSQVIKYNQILFLLGVDSVKKNEHYSQTIYQVRAVKNYKEVHKSTFTAGSISTYESFSTHSSKGLPKLDLVINVKYGWSGEGVVEQEEIIFWNADILTHVLTRLDSTDTPSNGRESIIYPTDKDGVKERVIHFHHGTELDQEREKTDHFETKIYYRWDGSKLNKEKQDSKEYETKN